MPAPEFTVNTGRFDPYKNFRFKVKWDNRYVAGISKMSALKRTTEVVTHRVGADNSSSRKSPGRSNFDAVTLERGVTHDLDFEKWASKVWDYFAAEGQQSSLADSRSTKPCPTSTPTPTPSPSSTSSWRSRPLSATQTCSSQQSPPGSTPSR